jgi:hypothetical protein
MNIFDKINELDLPKDSYVVVGGGILVALSLLEQDEDIDICVAPEVYNHLKSNGWQEEKWEDISVLKHDVYDIGTRFGMWNAQDLLADAMIIHGIPFMSIERLLQWKQNMGRPKDLKHIELIEHYLQNHKSAPV